jgi:hypothetical protein
MPILVKNIVHFFDKLEDYVRGILSKYPIPYAFVGGVSIVLFWRGVWHTADMLQARGGWWEWWPWLREARTREQYSRKALFPGPVTKRHN